MLQVIRTVEKKEIESKKEVTKGQKFVIWSINDEYVGISRYNAVKMDNFALAAMLKMTPEVFASTPVGFKTKIEFEIN